MMKNGIWSNWAGTATCRPGRVFHPQSREELVSIVRTAGREGKRVRCVGSGHSWSPLVPTDDFLVFTQRLDRVKMDLSVKDKPRVIVEAGATVRQMNDVLEAAGYALPANVVLESVRVGGLVQTGSHGSGWDTRTLSDMVHSMDVVTASGEVRTYEEGKTAPDVMNAARMALGTFGLLHRVTLDVVPNRVVRQVNVHMPLAEVLRRIEELVLRHDALDVFWWPFTDKAWIRSVLTTKDPVSSRRRHDPNDFRRAKLDVALSRGLYAWLERYPSHTPQACRTIFNLIPQNEEVVDLMSSIHFRRCIEDFEVNSIEVAVPVEPGFDAFHRAWGVVMRQVETFRARGIYPLNINVDARFIKNSDALLSPAYGNERTAYVGLITRRGTVGWEDLARAILGEWLTIPGARPHWAKEMPTSGELVDRVRLAYGPQIERFSRIRREEGVDPEGTFVNPFVARMLASTPAAEHERAPAAVVSAAAG